MEACERLVRTWIASGRYDELNSLISEISTGTLTLLDLVKALGEYLTSEEDVLRGKGVDLLSRVLEQCPVEKVNRQATRVLVTFFAGKLEEEETILPALKGLLRLSSLPTFGETDAIATYKAVFTHVKMKSMVQTTRYLVFQILDSLLARHRDALKQNNDEFLDCYLALVDGEKDPRNLLVTFSMDRVLCIEFDIENRIEDLFNVIFCYFPITFKPPADDPYGITSDDLRVALRSCLNATPAFGKLAMPLFCDKLLASSPMTKKDIVETIGACLPVYGPAITRKHAKSLWNFLKMEIFQPVNTEIEQQSLKVTQTLISTMDNGDGFVDEELIDEIIQECLDLMEEPEKTQAIPATKVMGALIGTTKKVTERALSGTVAHLLKMFRDPGETIHRARILTLLCLIVADIRKNLDRIIECGHQELLLSFKDEVLGAFVSGIKSSESSEAALGGIKTLVQMHDVLLESELIYILTQVNELLHASPEDQEIANDDALGVLIAISEANSKLVEEHSLPILFASLPDSPPSRTAHQVQALCWATLRWLSRLCVPAPLFETLVVRLMTKLELILICKSQQQTVDRDPELIAAYAYSILKTLASVLELKANAGHPDVPKYIETLVPRLYFIFISMVMEESPLSFDGIFSRVLPIAAHIITIVVRTQVPARQTKLAVELKDTFFDGKFGLSSQSPLRIAFDQNFRPFDTNSKSAFSSGKTLPLLSAAIIAFHPDVLMPFPDQNKSLIELQAWALDFAKDDLQLNAINQVIASFVNKNIQVFQSLIDHLLNVMWPIFIIGSEALPGRRSKAISIWLWVARALLLRGDERAMIFRDRLFDLIDGVDKATSWEAAQAVGRIAESQCEVLSKGNHAVIRLLYAQKYFKATLPPIISRLDGDAAHAPYLAALTSLISCLPKTTYASEMPTLMPYLVRGLETANPEIQQTVVNALYSVAEKGETSTQEHASTLCLTMLKSVQSKAPISLRVAALQYLAILPKIIRYDKLHPQRSLVLRELGKCLDDPKKAVRKEAVSARSAWYAYKG